jgi:hypothetical protein
MPVIRNFFETSHGKGPCDGLGGIVKNKASKAVLSGKAIIQNAKDLVNFCNENLGNVGASSFASRRSKYDHSKRTFMYVDPSELIRDPPNDIKTISGTRKLHSVGSTDKGFVVKTRALSCYCQPCVSKEGVCENRKQVDDWHVVAMSMDTPLIGQEYGSSPARLCDQVENKTSDQLVMGTYVGTCVQTEKGRLFLYLAITTTDEDDTGVGLRYMRKIPRTASAYIWPDSEDCSHEIKEKILFKCAHPELIQVGSRLRYVFEFSEQQKATMSNYQLK